MILALLAHPAFACGGLVTRSVSEQLAASDAQQAILEVTADSVTVDYRIHYEGNADDFAWIIPIPGGVADVAAGVEDRFTEIQEYTAPLVTWVEAAEEEGGDGCGCILSGTGLNRSKGDALGGSESGSQGNGLDVSVLGAGYAGDFEYVVLESGSGADLATWLTDRGYDVANVQGPIDAYVADPVGFQWVAVQLRPEVTDTPEEGVSITPLRIEYTAAADDQLHVRFPSRMSLTTQLTEIRTEVYVIGASHAALAGEWTADSDFFAASSYDADPQVVYADHLRSVGGGNRALVEVFRGEGPGGAGTFITRYDTIVAPSTNSSDIEFVLDGETGRASFEIILSETEYMGMIPVLALGALGAAWNLRRRA